MRTFGLIAEGVTDATVIQNVLIGYFAHEDEPVVNPVPVDVFGGWPFVLKRLREGVHREALQLIDYIIVHVDTDRCDEAGFGVSKRDANGQERAPAALFAAVAEHLSGLMGADFCAAHADRILFAIAVDETECYCSR